MKPIVDGDYLPDYRVEHDETADLVTFVNRGTMPVATGPGEVTPAAVLARLGAPVFDEARRLAPGWDVHMLSEKFALWWSRTGNPLPQSADALFLSFCRSWQEKNGAP